MNTTVEWYTPPYIFEAMEIQFDLDPASPGKEIVPWIPAETHYTENGLEKEWKGTVFLNPPYGRENLPPWLNKFVAHGNGVVLVPDRTSTKWWQKLAKNSDLILYLNKKIPFVHSIEGHVGSCAIGSCLIAIGRVGFEGLLRAYDKGYGVIGAVA
jgi:hypothetical protein